MSNISTIYMNYYCQRCEMHENSATCNACVCGRYMTNSLTGEIIDDAVYAVDAVGDSLPLCEHVAYMTCLAKCEDDGLYHEHYIEARDTGDCYSVQYARNNLYQCADCGSWFFWADSLRDVGGEAYCEDCAVDHSVIGAYHSNHYDFTPIGGTWDDDLIGFELEVDGLDYNREGCAVEVWGTFGGEVVLEEDCSLYEGFEIISQPHTLEALRSFDLEGLCNIPLEYGASSSPYSAGLHMHFSRSWFGDTRETRNETIYNLLRNYIDNWETLVDLSTREDYDQIGQYACCPRMRGDDLAEVVSNASYNRYCAVNLTNSKTVEFRLGSGTLDADYLRAWIELHVQLVIASRMGEAVRVNHDYSITVIEEEAVA